MRWMRLSRLPRIGWRRASSRAAVREAEREMRDVAAALRQLSTVTEQDFLHIGGKLAEFSEQTRTVSGQASGVAQCLSADTQSRVSTALQQMLDCSSRLERRVRAGDEGLRELLQQAGEIGRLMGGVGTTVRMFRTIGVLVQIETARFRGTDNEFGALAEEVRALAESIQKSAREMIRATGEVQQDVGKTLAEVNRISEGLMQELPAAAAMVARNMEDFESWRSRAHQTSERLAGQYGEVSASIADLVSAIQFHDITRQQVEHVADVLDPPAGAHDAESPTLLAVELQVSQLRAARTSFATASERIEQSLGRIAGQVSGMATETTALLGASEAGGQSFFRQLEAGFSDVLRAVSQFHSAEQQIYAADQGLSERLRQMEEFARAIQEIGIRIQRIGLNAGIEAARLGPAGEPLSVLASSIESLASQTQSASDRTTENLTAMCGRLQHDDRDSELIASLAALQPEMQAAIGEMHAAAEAGFSSVLRIEASGSRLASEVREARDSFQAGRTFAEEVDRTIDQLVELMGRMAQQEHHNLDAAARNEALEKYADKYTMRAERDVHRSIGQPLAGEPSGEAPDVPVADEGDAPVLAGAGTEDDLGDNVELF